MISIKKNLVNTLYSMINKKADKTQNNEEQEKKKPVEFNMSEDLISSSFSCSVKLDDFKSNSVKMRD